jgi:hypothetical protein
MSNKQSQSNNEYNNEIQSQPSDLALDFKKYGTVISGKEIDQIVDEHFRSLTEPPSILFKYGDNNEFVIPLEKIQYIIEDEINIIQEKYLVESIKQANIINEGLLPFLPVQNYENLIESKNVIKRNPFDWTILIQHKMPEKKPEWTDEIYEIIKRQKELYGKIEVRINKCIENTTPDKYYIYINRLSGRSPVYYDFRFSLQKRLKEAEEIVSKFLKL